MPSQSDYGRENYNAWTWGFAAFFALLLLWLWIIGRGPGAACCNAPAAAAASAPIVAAPMTAPTPVASATPAPPAAVATPALAAPSASAAAKPTATLYFATGKTTAPKDAGEQLADIVSYLRQNPASKAVVSGFNDPRGNPEKNAELSKNRAKAARDALKAAGIDEARVEMRKPGDTNQGGDPKQARRVEISVEP